ncbi:MAG: urease accessory UreF family protein [Chthoniobacteraceae bacterium]
MAEGDSISKPAAGTSGDSFDWLPLVLQTVDPLFPTGAYAHSLGLEEMARIGVVHNEATLRDFLHQQIIPALTHHELPFLRFAWEAATRNDLPGLIALDTEISAWKLSRELREASTQLGTRRLRMLRQLSDRELLASFEQAITRNEAAGHHLIVGALQYATTPLQAALAAYFYQSLAGFGSAALKLIRIGQEGCQRVLAEGLRSCPIAIADSLTVPREDAGWFNPLLEIASMRHERAFERLFIS